MKVQKRFLWADVIRILAIYLVLVLHSGGGPGKVPSNYFDINFLLSPIAIVCVPLFVMLSGALLLGKRENAKLFFQKRFTRLFLPWVFWTFVYTIYAAITRHLFTFPQIARQVITQFESFWFLPMIVCLYLLTPALRIFVQNAKIKTILFVITLWFIGDSLIPYTRDFSLAFPRQVDDGLVRQVINYIGYYLLGFALIKNKIRKSWIIASVLTIAGLLWTTASVYFQTIQNGGKMVSNFYSYISPSIVLLSCGIFLLAVFLCNKLELKVTSVFKNAISLLSTASLPVYFIHALIQLLLPSLFFRQYVPLISLNSYLIAAVLFLVSFAIFFVLYHIPILKRVAV